MIDGSEKRNHQLAFELKNSHVCKSAVKDHIVFSTEPESFCGVGKVPLISVYFSILNIYLRTISSYCPYFTFLVKTVLGGGGVIFFFWSRGGRQKILYDVGGYEKIWPL